jgi:hypothetical protein
MEAKNEHLKENLMRDTLSSVDNDAYNEDEFNYHEYVTFFLKKKRKFIHLSSETTTFYRYRAFNCMMTRRLQRRYKGVYRQVRKKINEIFFFSH